MHTEITVNSNDYNQLVEQYYNYNVEIATQVQDRYCELLNCLEKNPQLLNQEQRTYLQNYFKTMLDINQTRITLLKNYKKIDLNSDNTTTELFQMTIHNWEEMSLSSHQDLIQSEQFKKILNSNNN